MASLAPKFTVVVACKNPGPRLAAALESVWQQEDASVELIVIDGGSSDGTQSWLEARRSRLGALISEADHGVYDAMNKGVAAARGEWLLFLGADDRLAAPGILNEIAREVGGTEAAAVVGEAAYDDGRIYRLAARPNPIARNFVHHQAAFYRRHAFEEHGGFDTTLAIMADYDFNLRLWKARARFRALPLRVAVCGSRGLSDAGSWRGYREEITVRHRYFPPWQCWGWDIASVLRFARKRLRRTFAPSDG